MGRKADLLSPDAPRMSYASWPVRPGPARVHLYEHELVTKWPHPPAPWRGALTGVIARLAPAHGAEVASVDAQRALLSRAYVRTSIGPSEILIGPLLSFPASAPMPLLGAQQAIASGEALPRVVLTLTGDEDVAEFSGALTLGFTYRAWRVE